MTTQIIRGDGPSLAVEVTVNGSKSPVIVVRPREGGTTLDARTVALFDVEKREAWLDQMGEVHGEACRLELRGMVVDLAAEVATALASKPAESSPGQGTTVDFPDPEPWPAPVDLGVALDDVVGLFRRFVVAPKGSLETVALWAVLTYCVPPVDVLPKLAILSPTKRCGKTTLLAVLDGLVHRSLAAANVTPAALFRAIEAWGPTLLLDEADQFLQNQPEVIGVVNAGHTRQTAFVLRNVGEEHEPRRFSVFCPQAIACIGQLPTATLIDRSITVSMQRKIPGSQVERLRLHELAALCEPVRRKMVRWAQDHAAELRDADPAPLGGLDDRAQDNWRGLFALADLASSRWGTRARESALALLGEGDGEDDKETLLADLYALFAADGGHEKVATEDILRSLVRMDDRPYAEWSRLKKPMTGVSLAAVLRPFKIKPKVRREGTETFRGYLRSDFEPIWPRYGIPPVTPVTIEDSQDLTAFSTRNISESCDGSEKPVSLCQSADVTGVTGQNPPPDDIEGGEGENRSGRRMVRLVI